MEIRYDSFLTHEPRGEKISQRNLGLGREVKQSMTNLVDSMATGKEAITLQMEGY